MSDQPRPVWLTEDEFMALFYAVDVCNHHDVERIGDAILHRWRNAPSDPEGDTRVALAQTISGPFNVNFVSAAVLRALGMPQSESGV